MENFRHDELIHENLNQADLYLSGLKQLIKKQNSVNAMLHNEIKSLQLKNKVLVMKNTNLTIQVKSLEKKCTSKNLKLSDNSIGSSVEKSPLTNSTISESEQKSPKDCDSTNIDLTKGSPRVNTEGTSQNDIVEVGLDAGNGSTKDGVEATTLAEEMVQKISKTFNLDATKIESNSVTENHDKLEMITFSTEQNGNDGLYSEEQNVEMFDIDLLKTTDNDSTKSYEIMSQNFNTLNQSTETSGVAACDDHSKIENVDYPLIQSEFADCDSLSMVVEKRSSGYDWSTMNQSQTTNQCKICWKVFVNKYSLDRHYRMHAGEKPYACNICGRTFTQKSHMEKHEATHALQQLRYLAKHECRECGKMFQSTTNLRKHEEAHLRNEKKELENADKNAAKSENSNLQLIPPLRSFALTPPKIREKTIECRVCGKKYSSKNSLSNHMKIHDESKAHKCDVCWKLFPTKSSLETHYRVHTGEKPFQCVPCGKRFSRKSHLQIHQDNCKVYNMIEG